MLYNIRNKFAYVVFFTTFDKLKLNTMITINRDRINREIIGKLDKVYDFEKSKSYEHVFTYYQNGNGYKITIPFEIENSVYTFISFEDDWLCVEHQNKEVDFIITEGSTNLDHMYDEFISELNNNDLKGLDIEETQNWLNANR